MVDEKYTVHSVASQHKKISRVEQYQKQNPAVFRRVCIGRFLGPEITMSRLLGGMTKNVQHLAK